MVRINVKRGIALYPGPRGAGGWALKHCAGFLVVGRYLGKRRPYGLVVVYGGRPGRPYNVVARMVRG